MLELCLLLEALLATSIFFLLTFVVVWFFFFTEEDENLGWVEWEPRDTHHTAKRRTREKNKTASAPISALGNH